MEGDAVPWAPKLLVRRSWRANEQCDAILEEVTEEDEERKRVVRPAVAQWVSNLHRKSWRHSEVLVIRAQAENERTSPKASALILILEHEKVCIGSPQVHRHVNVGVSNSSCPYR